MARRDTAIVVGAGIGGASTALALRRRGLDVTVYDAWEPGHPRAASAGEHRILRSSHGGDGLYTRWAREARMAWLRLAEEQGVTLFEQSGVVLLASAANTAWEDASRETLAACGIPHFTCDIGELVVRLPIVDPQGLAYALWEPEAGFVYARDALLATLAQFEAEGGQVQRGRVTTDGRERLLVDGAPLTADVLIVACGAWMPTLFPRTLARFVRNIRQDVLLVAPPAGDRRYDHDLCPSWIDHNYPAYGIPAAAGHGFKAAIAWREIAIDVDRNDRIVDPSSIARSRLYLSYRFPGLASQPITASVVCQISNTADTHFLIDFHPEYEGVLLLCGGSGHLFKHGPVLGEYAADVALAQRVTDDRFAYRDRTSLSAGQRPQ